MNNFTLTKTVKTKNSILIKEGVYLRCIKAPNNNPYYTCGKQYKVLGVLIDSIVLEDDTDEGRDHLWCLTKLNNENYEFQFGVSWYLKG